MKRTLFKVGLVLPVLIILFYANALAKDPIYKGFFSDQAVGGYDTVAYFRDGKPVPGKKEFKAEYQGADWFFSSRENLEAFLGDPERYAPQYGGYCAWAVAQGSTAKGDPLQWTIYDNKLYLNYNTEIQNNWLKDKVNLIKLGDKNWPAVLK